jgi:hypothetical protein
MTPIWQKLTLTFAVVIAFAACNRMEPIYNVEGDAIPAGTQQKLSSEQVGKAIAKAAIEQGWIVSEVKPGLLHCTIKWKDHSAIADITYTKQDYNIELDSSQNLKESDGMIHRKYNEYVHKLQNEIDKKLSQVAYN